MDESVEMFLAEQKRLAEEGGPIRAFRRTVTHYLLSLGILAVFMFALLKVLNVFPRNGDHSMKLIYYGPILALLAVGSGLLLQWSKFRNSPFSASAWGFIVMAMVAVPAGAIDLIRTAR